MNPSRLCCRMCPPRCEGRDGSPGGAGTTCGTRGSRLSVSRHLGHLGPSLLRVELMHGIGRCRSVSSRSLIANANRRTRSMRRQMSNAGRRGRSSALPMTGQPLRTRKGRLAFSTRAGGAAGAAAERAAATRRSAARRRRSVADLVRPRPGAALRRPRILWRRPFAPPTHER